MIPIHDLEDRNRQEIRVVRLETRTHYDSTKPHRHNYFEFFVFEKGDGVHEIDFVTFPVSSNSIHIVAPGQVHQVRRELNTNGYVILFEPSIFEPTSPVAGFLFDHMSYGVDELSPVYLFSEDLQKIIIRTVNSIWEDYSSQNQLRNDFILNSLNLLCIHCMRSVDRPDKNSINPGVYNSFRRMLRNHFREMRKVKNYAEQLNVSEKQLNEIVSSKTGLSVSALIHQQVILEAKRLLNTGMSSKEVAFALNFEDPAHFSKFFKTQTGITPSDFQKVHV